MRKIRFQKKTINWKGLLDYILLILLSSLLFLNILIALPLTEKLTDIIAFDLNVSKDYWSKEYILELESEESTDLSKTRDVLFRRLNEYGVEEASIYKEDGDLRIVVSTTLPQMYVEELIRNPYQYRIVTRNEDVNFEDVENPYAQYMGENYDETEFDASTFRNIFLTNLPDSNGTDSYFGIAKTWPNKSQSFKNFLNNHIGDSIGVDIDGFVTPMYISDSSIFAIPLNVTDESIKAVDILYNSGSIPTSYTISEQTDLESKTINIDYIEVSIAIFIVIIIIYAYLFYTKIYTTPLLTTSLFATLLSMASMLTILKITFLPINPFILIISVIFIIILTRVIITNPESKYLITTSVFILAFIFKLLGIGYLRMVGNDLLTHSLLVLLCVSFSEYYITKISIYFKK
ncbi:hypothetical protein K8R14_05105 [bacterium]|nr:hypothetical protein [bacterium]